MEITTPSPLSGDKSSFKMIDVGAKVATQRRAIAEGTITLSQDAFVALRDKKNPKGDVLSLAEVAGIMAAKRTSDTIPLCHPLPLDYVRMSFELKNSENGVLVFCEVGTTAKTGVEMEALAGVNGALLTIYDLSKAVNPEIVISNIHLKLKEGGKSGVWRPATGVARHLELKDIKCAVITIGDRVSIGALEDLSGPFLCESLTLQGAKLVDHIKVSDKRDEIQNAVLRFVEMGEVELVITTGGTGLGPRDVTPEALEKISHRKIEGIGELLRAHGSKYVKTAWLSRSMACTVNKTLVIALPGSRNAVAEGFQGVLPIISHALHTLRGGNHD